MSIHKQESSKQNDENFLKTSSPIKIHKNKTTSRIANEIESMSKSLPTTMTKALKDYQEIAATSEEKLLLNSISIKPAQLVTSTTTPDTPEDPFHCHNEDIAALRNSPKTQRAIRILWLTVFVCLSFMVCEVIGGWWAQSLAIMTDAAHLVNLFGKLTLKNKTFFKIF